MTRSKMAAGAVKFAGMGRKAAAMKGMPSKIARMVDANAARKKHRKPKKVAGEPVKTTKAATAEIDEAQGSTDLVLARAPFRRLLKSMLGDVRMGKGMPKTAQECVESMIIRLAGVAAVIENHAGHKRMRGTTVEKAAAILDM